MATFDAEGKRDLVSFSTFEGDLKSAESRIAALGRGLVEVTTLFAHHTGKPSQNSREADAQTDHLSFGSSELSNWPRGIVGGPSGRRVP